MENYPLLKGYQMVLLWLIIFFILFYPLVKDLNAINRTIIYWCFITIFVFLFEMMFLFNYDYVCKKGNYYFDEYKCYWTDIVPLKDMFSNKMYLDLYSDYSLADYKYRQNIGDPGFHFVYFGEIYHGIFAGIMSFFVLYFHYINIDRKKYLLSVLLLAVIQLVMITWYMSPAMLELFIKDNSNHYSKTWWPPYLWNVPWFIIPILMIKYSLNTLFDT